MSFIKDLVDICHNMQILSDSFLRMHVIDEDEVPGFDGLPFSIFSLIKWQWNVEVPASKANALMLNEQQELSPYRGSSAQKTGFSIPSLPYVENPVSPSYLKMHAKPCLVEVYYANCGDLNLTIEMLTHPEESA
ncbi:hypothetical protein POM88_028828 [Heracleum sosnowskyi]|uniref:Uncharacterized protein n=1 Tax=Heracleum sosnowskyi TaxID=360622 RepID=A0AAD8HSS6_9APIA|nr:hypothetical protein POM88_028828 [Heracleum sosnowskyi]